MTFSSRTRLLTVALAASVSFPVAAHAEVTLHALMEQLAETSIIEEMLPEFTKETGIKVEFEKMNYNDMHDKLVTQLAGGSSYYNLLSVDFLWAGEFPKAGWLKDLRPYIEESKFDLSSFSPAMFNVLGYKGGDELYILPMYSYTMGVVYRQDLLKDPGLGAKYKQQYGHDLKFPDTLDEYVQINKFMKANAPGLESGTAMQGQRGDQTSMEFSNYLFAAGGHYLDKDGKVVLDQGDAGKKALDLYIDNFKNAAQQGAATASVDDTSRLMCAGKTFSMITYWWVLPQVDNQEKCPAIHGKVALATVPGGIGLSGAWGWGIPANVSQEEQDAAWKFIAWVQSKETEIKRALNGHAPVRKDVFQDGAVLKKYPYMAQVEKIVETGDNYPIFLYSAQYEDVIGTQVPLAVEGQVTSAEAIKNAADGLRDLIEKAN